MIKAVIFDMFETLITHFESPVYMGKQIACDIGITEAKFREIWDATDEDRTLGKKTLEEVIEESLRVNNRYSEELFEKIISKRKASKIECFQHLHPQIIPMLTMLKERNIKIGLITNCYYEERDVIKTSILFDYFDAVCMSCELGMQKPEREIFQKCVSDLSVLPEECLYVGDGGSFELEAARAFGMYAVQATWYLKDGVNQPAKRKAEFLQAESPMEVKMMVLHYKKATLDDLEVLTETRIAVLRAANQLSDEVDMTEVKEQSYKYYQEALKNDTHVAYLIFDGEVFVGAGGVSYFQVMPTYHNPTGKKAYIMNMYTKPEYRRRGIAYKTLHLLVTDAKARGISAISLEATDMGKPLYVKYGFTKMKDEMELLD